ncbi:hypothetical protein EMPG_12490 [Blastomyces silverae]|uniref:Protein kinase domain-containing protein n=1 Tax=Blastomyces silverae TaxID=2060906 RepID=A0A0H1BNA5_9EURO|nr:hypothetical protein EMPG_12490 [Blastomyces silverae]
MFSSFNEDVQPRLCESPFLRLPHDVIPDKWIFVYKYMKDDCLSLVRKQISMQARKQILKASLRGIAELHSHDIVHLDIKPDNIMIKLPRWRSPEGHFKGELNKPSDIFSFAAVCLYAMLGQIIFGDDEDLRKHASQERIEWAHDTCKVGDEESQLSGSWDFFGDDRVAAYHSYKPFSEWPWPNVTDDKFKDLIGRMANLDPQKRATNSARSLGALHPWFC